VLRSRMSTATPYPLTATLVFLGITSTMKCYHETDNAFHVTHVYLESPKSHPKKMSGGLLMHQPHAVPDAKLNKKSSEDDFSNIQVITQCT